MTLRERVMRLHGEAMAAKQRIFAAQDESDRILRAIEDSAIALPRVSRVWLARVRADLLGARARLEDVDNAITSELQRMLEADR